MATSAQIQNFIATVGPVAQRVGAEYGINPSLIMAQAALETGFGTSVPGNNWFGVTGPGQRVATHEQGANGLYATTRSFRAYPSLEASARDYASLIANNYPAAAAAPTVQQSFVALQANPRHRYATDSQYVQKLNSYLNTLNANGANLPSALPPANIPNIRPPNSSGGPDDRALSGYPANYTPIPLAPFRSPAVAGGNAGDLLAFRQPAPPALTGDPTANAGDSLAFSPVNASMADALPLVFNNGPDYGRVPQFVNASGSPDDRDALSKVAPPILPAAALANVPLPIPRPQHQPQATIAAPATAAAPQTWTAPSGHVYTVGDTLRTGGGTYVVTPSGIQKVGYTSPTANQSNILNSVVGHAIGDAMQGGVAQAKQAGTSLLNDAQGVLNWFTGGGNPVSVAPSPQTPSVPALNVNVGGLLGNLFKSPPPSIPGTSAAAASVPQSAGPAGGYYSTPYLAAPSTSQAAPYGGYIPGFNSGSDPFSSAPPPPRDLGVPSAAPAAPTTKTVYTTKTEQVANPAYQAWLADQSKPAMYGVEGVPTPTLDANGNVVLPSSYLGASTPAPPKTITKTIRVPTTVTVPALKAPVAPVVPLSPPEDELRALREAQMNPFQRLFNASPIGHVVNFLNGSDQAYGGTTGGLLSLFARGGPSGGLLGALSQPAYKANSAASLVGIGLTPSQANTYAAGGAAMQGAYPNPVVAAVTGALNPQVGSIAAPSTGGVISPFHSF